MTEPTGHTDEYHDAMVSLLELIWGEGFMAPGGATLVRQMVREIDVKMSLRSSTKNAEDYNRIHGYS